MDRLLRWSYLQKGKYDLLRIIFECLGNKLYFIIWYRSRNAELKHIKWHNKVRIAIKPLSLIRSKWSAVLQGIIDLYHQYEGRLSLRQVSMGSHERAKKKTAQ